MFTLYALMLTFRPLDRRKETIVYLDNMTTCLFLLQNPEELNIYIIWKFIPRPVPWYGGQHERVVGLTSTTLKLEVHLSVYRSHGCGYYFGPLISWKQLKGTCTTNTGMFQYSRQDLFSVQFIEKNCIQLKTSNILKYNSSMSHLLFSLFQKSIVARYFSFLKNQRLTVFT